MLRKALELRYRLLPYWYTLAWEAGRTDAPPVRPLCWSDPDSAELRAADDAFLLGDALLIAPVLEPCATRRSVALPPGEWRELEGDGLHAGPGRAELAAPLDRIPVLARAGSVLPGEPARAHGTTLDLSVFRPEAGTSGGGTLYSDAGDGFGPHRVDRFALEPTPGGFTLAWTSEGDHPWPYDAVRLDLKGFSAPRVLAGGAPVPADGDRWAISPGAQVTILETS